MKQNLGIVTMNKKLFLSACIFGLFGLAGCVYDTPYEEGNAVVPSTAPSPCDSNYLDAGCQEQFVNYSQVAADYRTYGERTPRDVRVSQAGAGNNMTAVIPPSVENEVMTYEQTILSPDSYDGVEDTTTSAEDDQTEDWVAEEGQNLKALLLDWSDRAGWRLVWDTNRNYTLTAGAMFRGTFADVSSALIRAFARAKPAPIATFYKGNRVLVVETMEDENAY